jgi:hypothetical protein
MVVPSPVVEAGRVPDFLIWGTHTDAGNVGPGPTGQVPIPEVDLEVAGVGVAAPAALGVEWCLMTGLALEPGAAGGCTAAGVLGMSVTVGVALGVLVTVGAALGLEAGSVGEAPRTAGTPPAMTTRLKRTDAPKRLMRNDDIPCSLSREWDPLPSPTPGMPTHSGPMLPTGVRDAAHTTNRY